MKKRKRIKQKVIVTTIVKQINQRQETYTKAIKNVMVSTGKNYQESKETLLKELRFKSMIRELNNI